MSGSGTPRQLVSKDATRGGPPLVPPLLDPLLELPLPEPLLPEPLLLLPDPLLLLPLEDPPSCPPLELPLPLEDPPSWCPPSWCPPLDEPLELAPASQPPGDTPVVSPDPHAQRMVVRAPAASQWTDPLLDAMHREAPAARTGSTKWRDSLSSEIAAEGGYFEQVKVPSSRPPYKVTGGP
jgi:hypothetical protein